MVKSNSKPKSKSSKSGGKKPVRFVTWFRHPKTGEIIRASDHGLKAFPLYGGNQRFM